jgi:hypothetical protein
MMPKAKNPHAIFRAFTKKPKRPVHNLREFGRVAGLKLDDWEA